MCRFAEDVFFGILMTWYCCCWGRGAYTISQMKYLAAAGSTSAEEEAGSTEVVAGTVDTSFEVLVVLSEGPFGEFPFVGRKGCFPLQVVVGTVAGFVAVAACVAVDNLLYFAWVGFCIDESLRCEELLKG